MAQAIVRGIERDRLVITADVADRGARPRAPGCSAPYVRWTMDRTSARSRPTVAASGADREP